jgi:prepilin-type N-terminal cleavage/methylation domain-containing protein
MQNKGFTLIELLLVISIISLLSTVVMSSLNQSRKKAQEAAIKQDLQSIKTQAELSYSKVGNYSQVATDIAPILARINKNGGNAAFYRLYNYDSTQEDHYAVSVKFNSDLSKKWSVSDQYGVTTWDTTDTFNSGVQLMNWSPATTACQNSGKRLPTSEELKALWLAYGKNPDGFVNSGNMYYWSNTTYQTNSYYAWSVLMADGFGTLYFRHKTTSSFRARCVK